MAPGGRPKALPSSTQHTCQRTQLLTDKADTLFSLCGFLNIFISSLTTQGTTVEDADATQTRLRLLRERLSEKARLAASLGAKTKTPGFHDLLELLTIKPALWKKQMLGARKSKLCY